LDRRLGAFWKLTSKYPAVSSG